MSSKHIYLDQVGFLPAGGKRAVLNFPAEDFTVTDAAGQVVYRGRVSHFGTDDISGVDTYVADFDDFETPGAYRVQAGGASSASFAISEQAYDGLFRDICKTFYYLRCGAGLSEEYAGLYVHGACHDTLAVPFADPAAPGRDVTGGWHDAGDYGRYSTAGAVAAAHILLAVRFFGNLKDLSFHIPAVPCDQGVLPDILAEVKYELDFLLKMQREDGAVWHKVSTRYHAAFVMPEEDRGQLYLYDPSSMAAADVAAVFALAYTVYKDYDAAYADRLLTAARRSHDWLMAHPEPVLFKNPPDSGTGEYGEWEDISNRYWAACALYEATGEEAFLKEAEGYTAILEGPMSERRWVPGLTGMGWAPVSGLGSLSLLLSGEENDLTGRVRAALLKAAEESVKVASRNGFGLCMKPADFFWGSNMELGKHLMILTVADLLQPSESYERAIQKGLDYLLGCNALAISFVTGNGERAFRNPHLRPTAADNVEDPWPGLVSGGPNAGRQDATGKDLAPDLPPMCCYLDRVESYSFNEITIYWNSPFVFVLAGIYEKRK
ncbi:MAG: glycoside hydrolase family 9 protein [Lachnospiraceae bacterium]|nr:glycoside hydrolase family 9 protein [Lachnospiraceae bacterium]